MLIKLGAALKNKVKSLEEDKAAQLQDIESNDSLSWQQYQVQKSNIIGRYKRKQERINNKQIQNSIKRGDTLRTPSVVLDVDSEKEDQITRKIEMKF